MVCLCGLPPIEHHPSDEDLSPLGYSIDGA